MLLKSADGKEETVHALESLLARLPAQRREPVQKELRILKAGAKAEKDAAYHIDFHYKAKDSYVVIHDLRIEVGDRTAQIDHLLVNKRLDCFVLETKSFHAGLKITEDGEFLRWNDFKKAYEGMPSPLQQNQRHIAVLQDAFTSIKLPTRLGMRLSPTFYSYVLVSADARVIRPAKLKTDQVIHLDRLQESLHKQIDNESMLTTLSGAAKMVDQGTLVAIGRQLIALHRPIQPNVDEKFGYLLGATSGGPLKVHVPEVPVPLGPICKECGAGEGAIAYGRYGYYFTCAACTNATTVRVDCSVAGHKARVRKDGPRFFRECGACGTSAPYFTNPAGA